MVTKGLYIKERTDIMEVVTGFDRENVYDIMDIEAQRGAILFQAKEKSSCCSRNCTGGDCRPFNVKIDNLLDRGRTCIWLEKPQTCTYECLNRPILSVFIVNEQNNSKILLGKVVDPYKCCEFTFIIEDHTGQPVFTLSTPRCQQSLLCGHSCHCNECQKVDFTVTNASGTIVGTTKRRGKGYLQNMLSDKDVFEVEFNPDMPWNHRVLLLSTAVFIDFRMFNHGPAQPNHRNRHRGGLGMGVGLLAVESEF